MILSFFILIIGISFFMYCYLANKINSMHRQIIVLSRQNNELKVKLNKQVPNTSNIIIKYKSPDGINGTIIQDSVLYICPLEDSAQLTKLTKNTPVNIIDSAEISGTVWYEIALKKVEKINHKGWVKSTIVDVIPSNNMYNI